jgi:hypothetical protein
LIKLHSALRGRHSKLYFASAALALALSILAVAWLANIFVSRQQPNNRVDALHAACVQDMIARTCKVMDPTSGAAAQSAKEGDLVFIAGVGAITATDYQALYAAGDAMCAVVREACTQNWEGTQCLTARKVLRQPSN